MYLHQPTSRSVQTSTSGAAFINQNGKAQVQAHKSLYEGGRATQTYSLLHLITAVLDCKSQLVGNLKTGKVTQCFGRVSIVNETAETIYDVFPSCPNQKCMHKILPLKRKRLSVYKQDLSPNGGAIPGTLRKSKTT
ncbi:hypothetical protein EJ03DRAFT_99128 [Teratosphaeria nubilosa]|uniref:Uncharacterized protein n=1 Tax=Teratosphaeria nubilosa TaxID=161662 RepID=A0A6G1L895_9PEZI|nr:hypothetical protein EJ03DRAFT_99128 [Teratosphaeria nubilosa]